MKLGAAGLSDVGQERDHNEDSYAVEEPMGLFIVADGMGGHLAGEVASATSMPSAVPATARSSASTYGCAMVIASGALQAPPARRACTGT